MGKRAGKEKRQDGLEMIPVYRHFRMGSIYFLSEMS